MENCQPLFEALDFTDKESKLLWKTFEKLDKDTGGSVDFAEFAEFFHLGKSKFTERCFLMLDTGATGEINFPQFVLCCWNYCTYDRKGLTTFAFRLYDIRNKGEIEVGDLQRMCEIASQSDHP